MIFTHICGKTGDPLPNFTSHKPLSDKPFQAGADAPSLLIMSRVDSTGVASGDEVYPSLIHLSTSEGGSNRGKKIQLHVCLHTSSQHRGTLHSKKG